MLRKKIHPYREHQSGLHNSETSKGQIDHVNLPRAAKSISFCCSLKENSGTTNNYISEVGLLQHFLPLRQRPPGPYVVQAWLMSYVCPVLQPPPFGPCSCVAHLRASYPAFAGSYCRWPRTSSEQQYIQGLWPYNLATDAGNCAHHLHACCL